VIVRALACLVLDLDDTLFLERDYARSGFEAIGPWAEAELGVPSFASRAWAELEGGRRGDVFDAVLRGAGRPATPAAVAELVRRYRAHRPRLALLPDARAALEALVGRVRLAAVSDGPLESQRAKAEALGLARWVDPIVLTAALGPGLGKPHPRAFVLVEEATGARGAACAYVGDNPAKDFGGPRSLGWRTIRVRRPGALHVDVPSGDDVDEEIESFAELRGF
jgi:putative hydrolase of the HAD superfamily